MQAGDNHQCNASNRWDTRQRLTRSLELDKENSRVAGDVHTRRPYEEHPRQADAGVSVLQQWSPTQGRAPAEYAIKLKNERVDYAT